MSIQRLRALIAIAESGSFEEAANRSFVSRSAVSLRMKALEDELNVELFDRNKRPPILNETGYALVEKARKIVDDYDMLERSIKDQFSLRGEINIGCINTAMTSLMPGSIRELQTLSPDLHVRLSPDQSPELVTKVDQKYLDAAVVAHIPYLGPHLEFRPLVKEPLVVLAPLECTLKEPREILETLPFIRFTRRFWTGQAIEDWLHAEGIKVHQTMELDGLDMISTMVHNNLGASIIPLWCVPPPNPTPVRRILLGPSAPPRILGLITRKDNPKQRLTNLLYQQIENVIEKNTGANSALVENFPGST